MFNKIVNLIGLLALSFNSAASSIHEQIREQATEFVSTQLASEPGLRYQVSANKLDPRTQVPDCSTSGFDYQLATGKPRRNNSVLVTCADDTSWRLYLPVRAQLTVAVVTSISPIQEGSAIPLSSLEVSYLPENKVRGSYFTSLSQLQGAKLKRPIRAGQVLTGRDICIVCKGDIVTLSAKAGGLTVATEGTALSDGSIGDSVRVQNNQSKRSVTGRIASQGLVEINL